MSDAEPELERLYNVPLSRAWIAARHRRTKRAVNILKEFAQKHMKSSEIKIDTALNERLWERGITSPPRKITVKMSKDEDGVVTVSLPKETKPAEGTIAKDKETELSEGQAAETEKMNEQVVESEQKVAESAPKPGRPGKSKAKQL